MATILQNSANITYEFAGQRDTATSNIATTNLLEEYNLKATKQSQNSSWRPAENLTFLLRINNDGIKPIFAISIQDNLGGTDPLMVFVEGSAKLVQNGTVTPITPTSTSPLTIALPNTLEAGNSVLLTYIAKVKSDIASSVTEITNEVTVAGHEESSTGTAITVTPNPSITLPKASYASLKIDKSVDKESAAVGDTLNYIIRLENSGNTEAQNVVIKDLLPENFSTDSIKSEVDGTVTEFTATDYSIDTDNKLILPTSTTKTISVPAATAAGGGVTIVTITGTINA